MDRRSFLRLTGYASLAGVAVACGGGKTPPPPAPAGSLDDLSKGKSNSLSVVNPQPSLARADDRLALALLAQDNSKIYEGGTARAWLAKTRTEAPIGPVELTWHGEGLDRGVYVGRASFASEGVWLAYVEARPEGAPGPLYGGLQFQVGRQSPQPIPGEKAPSVATPTVGNPRGVDPICTRNPVCSLHAVSLDQALANGKPTVLIIGTPRFCTSRICGPVLDIVEKGGKDFAGRVNFVHIEQYVNDKPDTIAKRVLAPGAAAYKLELEPVVYYIKGGTITEWTVGPTDVPEVRDLTGKLLA